MKGDVSLGKKFVNLISSSIWIRVKNFSESTRFLVCTSLQFRRFHNMHVKKLRPKPKSSGLGVEANLDFHDKNFFS